MAAFKSTQKQTRIINPDAMEKPTGSNLELQYSTKKSNISVPLSLLPFTLSSAVTNASLTLFGQSLYAESLDLQRSPMQWLIPIALLLFLASRFADYETCRQTRRACIRQARLLKPWVVTLAALTLLSLVRATVRKMFGMDALLSYPLADSRVAEEKFGAAKALWLEQVMKRYAPNQAILWIGHAVSLVLLLAGQYFIRTAFND